MYDNYTYVDIWEGPILITTNELYFVSICAVNKTCCVLTYKYYTVRYSLIYTLLY